PSVSPLVRGGPEMAPHPPNVRGAPAQPWRPSVSRLVRGGPRNGPHPPNVRGAPAEPWRPSVSRSVSPLVPYPWVQDDVEDVDHEVDEHVDAGDDEKDALDHRVVAPHDGVYRQAAQAGQREDALGHHGAADQQREADADDGHYRQRGVLQRMADEHPARGQALGEGRAD